MKKIFDDVAKDIYTKTREKFSQQIRDLEVEIMHELRSQFDKIEDDEYQELTEDAFRAILIDLVEGKFPIKLDVLDLLFYKN